MRTLRSLPLLVLLALAPAGAPAQAAPATSAAPASSLEALRGRLQARLDSLHRAGRFPGATVGVALRDGSTLSLAVGWADTAARVPMRPGDRMLAGSVGKTYVAAVALQLSAEGKLPLDAPISTWLGGEPWFPRLPNARDITVRMLMQHTSGLRRYELRPDFTADLQRDPQRTWTPEQRVAYVLGDSVPFAAGRGWEYSDTNYVVLGMIVERITGRPLFDEVRRRLLEPLGLRGTIPSDRPDLPGVVQGYAGPRNPFGPHDAMIAGGRMVMNPQMEWAGGGMAASAEDLARWGRALWGGRVLGREATARMADGVPAALGPGARYGLATIVRDTPLGPAWGHSGFFPGWVTNVEYFPGLDAAVAVQVNTSTPGTLGTPLGRMVVELAREVAAAGR